MTQTHSAAPGCRAAARSLAKLTQAAHSLVLLAVLVSLPSGIERLVPGTSVSVLAGEGA